MKPDIQQAMDDAERIQKELQELIYVISHDFNGPVRHINGFTKLLKDRNEGQLDDKSELFIEQILTANARLEGMIEGLLSVSRINTRQSEFEPVPMRRAVSDIVHEITMMRPELRDFAFDLGPIPNLQCDKQQVVLALRALIDNALTYHSQACDKSLSIGAAKEGDYIAFRFSDQGIGIAPKDHEAIFKPLKRAVVDSDYPGRYGVGLALVDKVMARHSGHVTVQSELGQGSTFTLYFPSKSEIH